MTEAGAVPVPVPARAMAVEDTVLAAEEEGVVVQISAVLLPAVSIVCSRSFVGIS